MERSSTIHLFSTGRASWLLEPLPKKKRFILIVYVKLGRKVREKLSRKACTGENEVEMHYAESTLPE